MSPRPRREELCRAECEVKARVYTCRRKIGHEGAHKEGQMRWEDVALPTGVAR